MNSCAISAQLVIEREREPDACVLTLYGELDLASSALLESELAHAESEDPHRLVVDLGGLEFMDCSGLGVLLDAQRRSLENGRELFVRRGPRSVHRVFELTKTISRFAFDG
jgi:anti-sigma B factor antagonist